MPTELIIPFVSVLFVILGAVWGHSLWLSKQFASLRELIYHKVDQLENNFIQKLEYHERHDDSRFADIHNSIWEIRLRNAAQGILTAEKEKDN
jgi:hypothetical protein